MKEITSAIGQLTSIQVEDIALTESFVELGRRFSDLDGTVALLSGGGIDSAKYNILAVLPVFTLASYGQQVVVYRGSRQVATTIANPFDALQTVLDYCQLDQLEGQFGPIMAGLFGYLSYDLKDHIETIPKTTVNDIHLPDMLFYAPSFIIVQDVAENHAKRIQLNWESELTDSNESASRDFNARMSAKPVSSISPYHAFGELKSNFSKPEYIDAIDRIRQYIEAGDIYQVNFSHRFEVGYGGDAYSYFSSMFAHNPAPFFAYINGGTHQIVSTSPERFVFRDGTYAETRPIKGTCPRSDDPEKDAHYKTELLNSLKDEAELSMIVDLLRNDLGKVCQAGTVKVKKHKHLEAYQNVYHLVSTIVGDLSEDTTDCDLIKALFPGGSITGCPKIRSMEIIDELEQYQRHIYTGSIGYISFHKTMDFSIAIRTATITNDRLIFSVGGGIVYDSKAESEHAETLSKGQTMISHLAKTEMETQPREVAWINGKLTPRALASIPIDDLGLAYGYGLFETIRCDRGFPRYLDLHISRLTESYQALFNHKLEHFSWHDIITLLLRENDLTRETAVIKILVTKGGDTASLSLGSVIITAKKYSPRSYCTANSSVALKVYPHSRHGYLADYKTLNYLFYYHAGRWVRQNHGDEALILNTDQSISETNSANVVILRDKDALVPKSPHVLPGITQQLLLDQLKQRGYSCIVKRIMVDELRSTDRILITNSLIGAVPVGTLNDLVFSDGTRIAADLTSALFGEND